VVSRRNKRVCSQNEDLGLSALFKISRRRLKRCFFKILGKEMDVLGLEGLEYNYKKLRGFMKMAKVRKSKFKGPKSNFKKICKQPWPTSTCQH